MSSSTQNLNNEAAICEEIGLDLYNFKSILESALDLISETATKDQRGDFIMPESFCEITEIYYKLSSLKEAINEMQSIIRDKVK
jgi:hypothetical protein